LSSRPIPWQFNTCLKAALLTAAALAAFAAAEAQEPVRVAEADHVDGWHGLFK